MAKMTFTFTKKQVEKLIKNSDNIYSSGDISFIKEMLGYLIRCGNVSLKINKKERPKTVIDLRI